MHFRRWQTCCRSNSWQRVLILAGRSSGKADLPQPPNAVEHVHRIMDQLVAADRVAEPPIALWMSGGDADSTLLRVPPVFKICDCKARATDFTFRVRRTKCS